MELFSIRIQRTFQLVSTFFGSHPKKEPKKCFPDYRMRHRKIRKDVAFQNKYISSRQR